LGGNGSGKSTLLQVISGYLSPSEGNILWSHHDQKIETTDIFKSVSLCTPLLSLYDEFTLRENVAFFLQFKTLRNSQSIDQFMDAIELEKQSEKQLKFFSSGMRQRVKLGLAILAETPVLLLDEPTSHLDKKAILWYQKILEQNTSDRSIFIASNSDQNEIFMCRQEVIVENYK
jgi:ABC-2 type transport system ATP-binding protein